MLSVRRTSWQLRELELVQTVQMILCKVWKAWMWLGPNPRRMRVVWQAAWRKAIRSMAASRRRFRVAKSPGVPGMNKSVFHRSSHVMKNCDVNVYSHTKPGPLCFDTSPTVSVFSLCASFCRPTTIHNMRIPSPIPFPA